MTDTKRFATDVIVPKAEIVRDGKPNFKGVADRVMSDMIRTFSFQGRGEKIWIAALVAVVLTGLTAYVRQLCFGLQVTGMRNYVSWGVYIINFVFFIGVSHAGTLISAILRVTDAEWRRPITRMAEAITVFALMVGAPMVIIDMGRPDRILNVILHGRLQSPLLWDVCSICTYMCGSILYLYVAMIPDVALLAKTRKQEEFKVQDKPSRRARFYNALSLGYRGTPEQRVLLEKALATMSVIIIPVAVSVHTVVSWVFGMTLRPGWHSTIFGPYFVIGAIYSGTAGIITAMVLFRKAYHLEPYITIRQFKNLGKLLLALNLLYIYFTFSEYLTTWYGSLSVDKRLIHHLMAFTGWGAYGTAFWSWAIFMLLLPAVMIALPGKWYIPRLLVASILINIGMWLKRFIIVVPTLFTAYIPIQAKGVTSFGVAVAQYHPTWTEWSITFGGLAFFLLMFTLFAKVFPIISIWETIEGVEELGEEKVGVKILKKEEVPA